MYSEGLGQTVNTMFDESCERWGSRIALVEGDTRLTFLQLRRRAAAVATGLRRAGVQPGDRVAVLVGVGTEWTLTFYALMRIGAIAIPLNLTWTGREIEGGLTLTEATVLVATDSFRDVDYLQLVRDQCGLVPGARRGEVSCDRLPHLRMLVAVSRTGNLRQIARDLREIEQDGALHLDGAQFLTDSTAITPETDSIYLLTSGTTSFPKPVRHVHQTLMVGVSNYADGVEATEQDSTLIISPNYHVAAYFCLLMLHLRGGTVHLMDHFLPRPALEIIERERVSLLFGFDSHFLMLKRDPHFPLYDISSLSRTMIGSNPASFDEIKSMGITHQGNIYGSSEYVASQTFFPYRDRHDEERMRNSHGRPGLGTEIRIVDPDSGDVLGPEEAGEICFRGPALFRGYYNMPDETAAAFDDDGFFHSGDYGWLDAKGYLYYRGRFKETVKSGGENVSMQEVELFLQLGTPWVAKAMIVAIPDPKWGEAVTAVVELRSGQAVDEETLREYCRGRLAGYKIPKRVLFIGSDEWVTTPTGKFDRKAMTEKAKADLGVDA